MALRTTFGNDGRPVYFKENAITRAADRIAELNAQYGKRALGGGMPREAAGPLGLAAPAPVPTPPDPTMLNTGLSETGEGGISFAQPMDETKRSELEAEWAAQTGQNVGPQSPEDAESEDGYDTSVRPDTKEPVRMLSPRVQRPSPPLVIGPTGPANLSSLERVDLIAREIVVGGVAFRIDDDEAAEFARLMARVVLAAVQRDMEKALERHTKRVPEVLAQPGTGAVREG